MREQQGASRIVSVGYYLPETRVRTAEMLDAARASRFGVTNNFIEDTMGIREVRHAASDQRPSDLAIAAAEQALAKTDINPDEIDLIIFCGIEGDYAEPSTAHIVQATLGLSGICFDVSNACLGFMTGVKVANDMIKGGSVRHALVCTGEKLSNLSYSLIQEYRNSNDSVNFRNRLGAFSAGDAGGAIILGEKIDKSGFLCFKTLSRGRFVDLCNYKMQKGIVDGKIDMGKITARGIHLHRALYSEFLESLKWTPPDINTVITHQTGERMWTKLADVFSVTRCKMTKTYDMLGNIATATFPVNLGITMHHHPYQKNNKVFIAMAGSGLSVCQSGIIL